MWMRKVEYDGEEDQRRFDEYEFDHPALVTRSWGGCEKQVDGRGRSGKIRGSGSLGWRVCSARLNE